MEKQKKVILAVVIVLVLILGIVLIVNRFTESPQQEIILPAPAVTIQQQPKVEAKDGEEVLPTVEMGNDIGVVQGLTKDSLTIKTDKGILTFSIKGAFNVMAFAQKGAEQKSIADVKTGSKVSVQYSKDKVVMSMYLLK